MALRIPLGDRPRHEDIDVGKANGLTEMVELMKSLWDWNAARRKTFKGSHISQDAALLWKRTHDCCMPHVNFRNFVFLISECCGITYNVFSRHSSQIGFTVGKVLTVLVWQFISFNNIFTVLRNQHALFPTDPSIYLYYCRTCNPIKKRQIRRSSVHRSVCQLVSTHVMCPCPQCKDTEHQWPIAPQEVEETSAIQSIR